MVTIHMHIIESGAVLQYGGKMGTGFAEDFPLPTPVRISEKLVIIKLVLLQYL
jgi:hypothetical protein